MKPKNLLDHLCEMESQLGDFSYENFTMSEAEEVKQAFLAFKNTLFEKINPANPQKTDYNYLKSFNETEKALRDFDMQTYDAVITHYQSYTNVLKSLKIETPMKSEKYNSIPSDRVTISTLQSNATVDLYPLLEDCMGEMELLEELIKLYEKNALEFIGHAKIYLKNEDYDRLRLSAHKIKAGLAMLKTNDLYSIVLQIEQTCKTDKDYKHLQFLFNCFLNEFPLVQNALQLSYNELKKSNY
ncbi:Hpt domain-containing protein [Euzebyella saccharophila]|uniref:Hpt domain-containing protein n=1 Tax=Euzebyella saccharophila TaxID=679664 RepID=A0ABV8JUZ2_9FLAO|nr:Hpt domain-containing protein [Euzebyella saccharophila]